MIIRILFLILFLMINNASGSTIHSTKATIKKTNYIISRMNDRLDILAKKISKKQFTLQHINNKISILNIQINKLNLTLNNSNKQLFTLNDLKNGYKIKAQSIQDKITDFISENYFNSLTSQENINDLINKEITKKILEKYSKKINKLIKENKTVLTQINSVNQKINLIKQKQNDLIYKKNELAKLLINQKKELTDLNKEKNIYKQKLSRLIYKQKKLQDKLANLKIIEEKRKITFKPVNINVKKVGSIYHRSKTASYYGAKTSPPVRGKIIKSFGSYIDPVYKIRIYNDSITIKPFKKNATVKAIFSGKIVYLGNNDNKKIIIIKHKNDLFSIYANLSKISPILKKGYYVKKGQIIARIDNTLEFEVTYKEKPINPVKIISLK